MKKILLFIYLSCLSSIVYGQNNFIQGYIVTKSLDTLQGYINNYDWKKNPNVIEFKQTISSQVTLYSPLELESFNLSNNQQYIGRIISSDKTPFEVSEMENPSNKGIVLDTVFLEVSVKGRASLYTYTDENFKTHFYIEKDTTGVKELMISRQIIDVEGQKKVKTVNRYVHLLRYLFADSPESLENLENVKLKEQPLKELFLKYNRSINEEPVFVKEKQKHIYEFYIVGGITSTKLKFSGTEFWKDLNEDNYKGTPKLTAGVALNFVLPRNMLKWSFYNELLYSQYKVSATSTSTFVQYYPTYLESSSTYLRVFDYSYLRLNNMIRYTLNNKAVKPFFNAGITNSYAIKAKDYQIKTVYSNSEKSEETKAILDVRRKFEFGVIAGAGAQYRKFNLELRYLLGNGMSAYTALSAKTNEFYLLGSYNF